MILRFKSGKGVMLMVMWIIGLAVVILVVVAVGVVMARGSRAARRAGMDRSPPAADVKVVERPH
jgi:hypothetical protein